MALEEPKLVDDPDQYEENDQDHPDRPSKRDDAPDYYKRPKFKRNIIPFETDDLSVRVIRERFLIPNHQVREGSAAAKAGLKLGDQIVTINGADASAMRLATAESVIKQAGEQLQLVVAKDDDEAAKNPDKPRETREIKFANDDPNSEINNPSAPKMKSNEGREDWIQPPERKVWHPIVWQQPPPPIPPDVSGKAPHMQLIRNIRRLLTETAKKPEEFQKHIEHMMLALPTGPRPKNDDDCWGDDPEPEPEPPKPKKKKAKKGKKKVVVRKRAESDTSEDSEALDSMSTPAAAADPIPEEA